MNAIVICVIPIYLNFPKFKKDLLAVVVLWFCPAFTDETSAYTSSPQESFLRKNGYPQAEPQRAWAQGKTEG
jgi:hypothetical protein